MQPAAGWVRIPRDPCLQGRFLKYDPCARVAQQLIRAAQVNKLMLRSTTEFLRRMSLDNLTNLWLGTFIEAPSPEAMCISTMVALPPVETPKVVPDSQGEVDYEELRRRAATKKIQGESDHQVQLVKLPLGSRLSIVIAATSRPRSDGQGHDDHRVHGQGPGHPQHDLRSRTGPRRLPGREPNG